MSNLEFYTILLLGPSLFILSIIIICAFIIELYKVIKNLGDE